MSRVGKWFAGLLIPQLEERDTAIRILMSEKAVLEAMLEGERRECRHQMDRLVTERDEACERERAASAWAAEVYAASIEHGGAA